MSNDHPQMACQSGFSHVCAGLFLVGQLSVSNFSNKHNVNILKTVYTDLLTYGFGFFVIIDLKTRIIRQDNLLIFSISFVSVIIS